MASLQFIIEELLPTIGASRALLLLVVADGEVQLAAEAVTHGARQIRNDPCAGEFVDRAALGVIEREKRAVVQHDTAHGSLVEGRVLGDDHGARAQIVAPLLSGDRLAGLIVVHDVRGPRQWESEALEAVDRARAAALEVLSARERQALQVTEEDLRDTALTAILDELREGLQVQRCTLRQDVNTAYAFPVTHESRGEGVWSLHGDFTIIQSGQPVIEKMLAERTQVVQDDSHSASDEPLFHVMLKHYGDLRSQIVTPLFRNDALAAVLSVHSLKELRTWSAQEKDLARSAARLLGLLIGATLK